MTLWLLRSAVRRAPFRMVLAALAVAFPVALLAATLLFVDVAVHSMTRVALEPVQVEQRALATSLDVDMTAIGTRLAAVPGVHGVDRFAAADVLVGTPGSGERFTARLFAVDPRYLSDHPWVGADAGALRRGALLNQQLKSAPPLAAATTVTVGLPGQSTALASLPVGGVTDLRRAATWFAIPTGEVQGDIAVVPRSIVVDYPTFDRLLRPALAAKLGPTTPVLNPGLTDLPPVDVELHIAVDHRAYPSDPGRAVAWSARLQRVLERGAPGSIVVADDAAESLMTAKVDATNAKVLFLLLGIPGVLAAAALGFAAESALAAAHRREDALLRLRGATDAQLARLLAAHGILAGLTGSFAGIVAAGLAVGAVTGRAVWHDVPPARLAVSLTFAVLTGAAVVAVRILRVRRQAGVAADRHLLERGWTPGWRRARLDAYAIGAGLLILGVNALTGGLRRAPIEGTPLALAFYVLLAPIALWAGTCLLAVRGLLAVLARRARPERARPLTSWTGAQLRWLGRRPARTAVALVLGVLAVAFGTDVLAFVSTYSSAKRADARAAFGADLHLTPATETPAAPPPNAGIAATTPVRTVPARVGSDRKSILAIDVASYRNTVTVRPRMLSGGGVESLGRNSFGILVAHEIADGFGVGPGDPLTVTVFPDDSEKSRNVVFHVVGVFRSVPPTDPVAELVMATSALPSFLLPAPDTYLARVAPGHRANDVAAAVRGDKSFVVTTFAERRLTSQRSLATLNLGGLSTLESSGAGLIAAVGIAVLGAFVVLERRRELGILRAVGADPRRLLAAPALEGAIATLGSVAVGVPVGLGLSMVSVRVLGLFFTAPPPLLSFPARPLAAFLLFVVGSAGLALAGALVAVSRVAAATILREP